jgi:acetyl esterase/lipase
LKLSGALRDEALAWTSLLLAKPMLALPMDWTRKRALFEAGGRDDTTLPGLTRDWTERGGVPGREVRPPAPVGRFLWLHGGGFAFGSPRTHAMLTDALASRGVLASCVPDYRLAPEHPFPAAWEDCLAVARDLAKGGEFALGGDSAGATLALAILPALIRGGIRPSRVALISPCVDLDPDRPVPERASDLLLPLATLYRLGAAYRAGADPDDPRLSPIHGDYTGAPPVLIHAARGEWLEGDADAIADRIRRHGGTVTLEKEQRAPHVWHLALDQTPKADRAVTRIARFLADGEGAQPG